MAALTAHGHDDHHDDHEHAPEIPYPVQLQSNRIGIWLFFVSELFLFAGLLAARFYLWRVSPDMSLGMAEEMIAADPSLTMPASELAKELVGTVLRPPLSQMAGFITTTILLISSYFMVRAEIAAEHGHRKKMRNSLWITFVLGLIFLLGVVVVEWGTVPAIHHWLFPNEAAIRPTDGPIGAVFYAMTGMHAFHVLTGLIFILIIITNGERGWYQPGRTWGIEACALYWHYVDVIWIFFYPALYLIGTVFHFHH